MPLSAAALTFPTSPSFPCSDATPLTRRRGRRRDPSSAMAAPRLHLATTQFPSLTARPCQARWRRQEKQEEEKDALPCGPSLPVKGRRRREEKKKRGEEKWASLPVLPAEKRRGEEEVTGRRYPSAQFASHPFEPQPEPARQAESSRPAELRLHQAGLDFFEPTSTAAPPFSFTRET